MGHETNAIYSSHYAQPARYAAAEARLRKGHLADFCVALKAKAVTVKQIENVKARVTHILALCKTEHIGQISPSAVQGALGTIREVGASKRSRKKGASLQTCNHYLRAVKQFTRWLWRDGRACEDSLAHLCGYNVQLDRRHDRRVLTDDELVWLIRATERGSATHGMTGSDRAVLYQVAVGTGFRANELRSLSPGSFDLDADPPTVTVEAGYSKHRRRDVQPMRKDLADLLQPWLSDKPSAQPVFCIPHDAAKLFRADLKAGREFWLGEALDAYADARSVRPCGNCRPPEGVGRVARHQRPTGRRRRPGGHGSVGRCLESACTLRFSRRCFDAP